MRHLDEIVIHCSDTPPSWMDTAPVEAQLDEIRRWHIDGNGWSDIGYHGVITRCGTILAGRSIHRPGAHVLGHNSNTLGVCLIGGKGSNADDSPNAHFEEDQLAALEIYIREWRDINPIIRVTGHNQHAARACPGFDVPEWLASINLESIPRDFAPVPAPVEIDAAQEIAAPLPHGGSGLRRRIRRLMRRR